jgi:heme oxygenase (mycobilin-producing)
VTSVIVHATCTARNRRRARRTPPGQTRDLRYPTHDPRMFVFVSHLTVPGDDHAALERHFRERSRLVDDFPGFLYLQLLRPEAGDATHTFLTAWESRDAFRSYMRSDEHAHSHSREPADIMARTAVRHEAYEVMMDSRRAREWSG